MAPLKVIGAGFGRTGTDSLRTALNKLGYNTHHMKAFIEGLHTDPLAFKHAYEHPEEADWDEIYKDFDAAVDWPTAAFVEQLVKKYPDAKVILTVRSADSWYKSARNTIWGHQQHLDEIAKSNKLVADMKAMIDAVVLDGAFKTDSELFKDEELMKKKFNEHNEWVKSFVPADRLLVMELGDGWEKLCPFLGKPIPDEPYPRVNSTQELQERITEFKAKYGATTAENQSAAAQ